MPRFLLIDNSLKGVGGHNYEYAVNLLGAAAGQGFEPVLACHSRFQGDGRLESFCDVRPVFRYTSYSALRIDARLRGQTRRGEKPAGPLTARLSDLLESGREESWLGRRLRRLYLGALERRLDDMDRGCEGILDAQPLQGGDHVFLPTATDLDLVALSRVLESRPESASATWHLLFHDPLFQGREPDHAAQTEQVWRKASRFRDALGRLPAHTLRLYAVTEHLALQYNRLGVGEFHKLEYLVGPAFAPREGESRRPLRITCAGAARREKGHGVLADLVRSLDGFASGQLQLRLQSKAARFSRRPRVRLEVPGADDARLASHLDDRSRAPVIYLRHPLPADEYARLVGSSDIGLLLYDSTRYYARCAGVLNEMLAAGVPVIVPAGCWLADQVTPAAMAHIDTVLKDAPQTARLAARDLDLPPGPVRVGSGEERLRSEISVPQGSSALILGLDVAAPDPAGVYLEFHAEFLAPDGSRIASECGIVGRRSPGSLQVMLPVPPASDSARLCIGVAYSGPGISVVSPRAVLLQSPRTPPLSAVARIAPDRQSVPSLVEEMVRHHPHYRRSAARFSQQWREERSPQFILETLLQGAGPGKSRPGALHIP